MRLIIAVPVLGLLAGAVAGVRWSDVPAVVPAGVLLGWLVLALHGQLVDRPALLIAGIVGAFGAGGFGLAADAWHRAWKPSLRVAFDRQVLERPPEAADRPPPGDEADEADGDGTEGVTAIVEGTLRTDASPTASGGVSLSLDVRRVRFMPDGDFGPASGSDQAVEGGVRLTVGGTLGPTRMHEWVAGRRIRAPAILRRAPRYLNPGVPDQERALARRGTILVGSIKSAALVEVAARGTPVDEWAGRLRAYCRLAIAEAVGRWSPRSAGIVSAILIGDRTGLDPELERRLQEAGTYHVIAISGGNIAILAGLALAVFRIAGMLGRAAMVSAAAGLAVYGYVVVGGASVTRATLMALVYFAGRACDLAGPPLHGLMLVAGIMVLVDPLAVVDVASLLSFGATVAIIAVAAHARFEAVPRLLVPALGLAAASLAAEAALFPVSAFVFQRVTIAGLVLNFGAIPLMGLAQLAGMAVVPLHAVWPGAAGFCGYAAHLGAEGLVRTADLVSLAPWSTWRVASPSPWAIVAYYGGGAAALLLGRGTHSRRYGVLAGALGCVAAGSAACMLGVAPAVRQVADGRLHVTFIDVGQGDSALVRFPRGSSMLVDAGGLTGTAAFDLGDRVVGPVARHLGLARLDTVVLTHGDADHMGGMPAVLRDFRPWDLWDGIPVPPFEPLRRLRAEAQGARTRWTTVQATDRAVIDDVEVVVWHPVLPDWERQRVRNDDSVVLELRWRDVSFVFTGDIGREVEIAIAPRFAPARLRVLKVPHHGSATSSSAPFVRALAPDVAVVSVGRGNRFGHPAPAVLERYRSAGVALFRTDRDGAVSVDTDGRSLDVHAFTRRTLHLEHHGGTKGPGP